MVPSTNLNRVYFALLIPFALVGYYVLFSQNPVLLLRARVRYLQAVLVHKDLRSGPCLGKIAADTVLDIAHLPRQALDNDPKNQCQDYLQGSVHHFVEMSPQGEIIVTQ